METPSQHSQSSSFNPEVHMSFPSSLQPLDRTPSHTIATTKPELGIIPGIENGPKEALVGGLLGAAALLAVGAYGLRPRRGAGPPPPGSAPTPRDRHPATTGFEEKRDAAARYAAGPYSDASRYAADFRNAHMTRRILPYTVPDAPTADGEAGWGQSTTTRRIGSAPRERIYYQDRAAQARARGEEPAAKAGNIIGAGRSVRDIRKGNRVLGREKHVIHMNNDKFGPAGPVLFDRQQQESYIAAQPNMTGPEKRQMRKAGRKVRRATAVNNFTEQRMRGLFRR